MTSCQFSMTKIIRIFLFFFSLKNTNLGAHFLLMTFFDKINFKIFLLRKWCPIFDSSPLIQNLKFNNFLCVCWFLGKNLSKFVSPVWKLHNQYCHNCTHIIWAEKLASTYQGPRVMQSTLCTLKLWSCHNFDWCTIDETYVLKIFNDHITINSKRCMNVADKLVKRVNL